MTSADVRVIAAYEEEIFGHDAWSEEMVRSELNAPGRHYLVVTDSQTIVGYAGLFLSDVAEIMNIAVLPALRGAGLGRLLLGSLLDIVRESGINEVFLEVRLDNDSAIGLYQSVGFERISIRRGYYDAGRADAAVMRLRLNGGGAVGL